MNDHPDRLYELLPVIYRQRDAEQGYPLRALLQVIAEQVQVVENDIAQLYENWFIETCQDWVTPYIGDLMGYQPVLPAGEPSEARTPQGQKRSRILIPRRELANTIRYRRRKGGLALLELLAGDVADWPARAVEFCSLLGQCQGVNYPRPRRGRTVDLRQGEALDWLGGPFDELAHSIDLRRTTSSYLTGRYNLPSVGLFVWRLRPYSVTETPAYNLEDVGANSFTFSALGNNTPLYTKPQAETDPTKIAGQFNLPIPISRRALEAHLADYYGEGKSLFIWRGQPKEAPRQPVPAEDIIVADLSDWEQYRPRRGKVAVDPELGRMVFSPGYPPKDGIWVSYHYAFSADIGGGEYERPLSQPEGAVLYRVGEREALKRINDALNLRNQHKPQHAVIEIADSGVYVEQINIELGENQSLQLRAANRVRPIIRLLDWQTSRPDFLRVHGAPGSRFSLDGLLITGRGVQIEGQVTSLTIRHSTLVPGWALHNDCEPRRPTEKSLELYNAPACVVVEHSIVGAIQVHQDEVLTDPMRIYISDSVLDATSPEGEALGAYGWPLAHAVLTIARSTVFGQVHTHAIELAEDSLFNGYAKVGRRQRGCMRFCYVTPDSRTPRRYNCQPDLVMQAVHERVIKGELPATELGAALEREQQRVRPQFVSVRYGTPTYCRLADTCADEIKHGASDESEMGIFHDLYQPQREANLRARLAEFTPAGTDAGILFVN